MRKKWIIDKTFQFKFIGTLLIPILMINLLFLGMIEYNFNQLAHQALEDGLKRDHMFFNLLSYQKKFFQNTLLVCSTFVGLLMMIWGIYVSHRIAGPLTKLERMLNSFQTLNDAKGAQISFRKKDYFQNVAKAFNEFIKRC